MQQTKSGSTLILSGNIDNNSITVDTFRTFQENLHGVEKIVFQDVNRVDSTVIALLAATKRSLKDNFPKLENIPQATQDLLNLYKIDINDWICS